MALLMRSKLLLTRTARCSWVFRNHSSKINKGVVDDGRILRSIKRVEKRVELEENEQDKVVQATIPFGDKMDVSLITGVPEKHIKGRLVRIFQPSKSTTQVYFSIWQHPQIQYLHSEEIQSLSKKKERTGHNCVFNFNNYGIVMKINSFSIIPERQREHWTLVDRVRFPGEMGEPQHGVALYGRSLVQHAAQVLDQRRGHRVLREERLEVVRAQGLHQEEIQTQVLREEFRK